MQEYEVYVCKDADGEVLYVGQGKTGRSAHCNSGVSHVYGLNRLFFMGHELIVEILETGLSKESALVIEKDVICDLQPKFNLIGNRGSRSKAYNLAYLPKTKPNLVIQGMSVIVDWIRVAKDVGGKYKICREVSCKANNYFFDHFDREEFTEMRQVVLFLYSYVAWGGYNENDLPKMTSQEMNSELVMNTGVMIEELVF